MKKELKKTPNWTSSTETSSTGRTDAHNIGASVGCRKIRRPGFGTSLCASGDQVKKEVKHRMNRRFQERHRCIQCIMFQRRCQAHKSQAFSTGWTGGASEQGVGAMTSARAMATWRSRGTGWTDTMSSVKPVVANSAAEASEKPTASFSLWVTGRTDAEAPEVPMPTQKLANG